MNQNIDSIGVNKKIILDDTSFSQFNIENYFAGHTPRVFTRAFGCLQSTDDAQRLTGIAMSMGYLPTEDVEVADLIIINTCAVRENAEDRLFGNIGALKHLKAENPRLIIAVTGCSPEQEGIKNKLIKSYPYVDIILGSNSFAAFAPAIVSRLAGGGRYLNTEDIMKPQPIIENLPTHRKNKYTATIPIMYGCNKFCTYCIVPFVRGRERSRNVDDIALEASSLVADGVKEIILIGQNVNSYDGGTNFAGLLERLDKIDGEFIIRYMSSHPKDFSKALIDTIASSKHIERHMHLPLQSGSNDVLKDMKRGYTIEEFLELTDYYKQKLPDGTITTDIIVGFPTETEADFHKTLDVLKKVRFDNIYSFIYSKRVGTKAADMLDITDYSTKSLWHRQLLDVQEKIADELMSDYVGKVLRVLIEKSDYNSAYGKNTGEIAVKIENPCDIGKFVDVKIHSASRTVLHGSTTNS